MMEVLEPDLYNYSRPLFATWLRVGSASLEAFGLTPEDAAIEARIMVDAFYGLQYDLIISGDEAGATASFNRMVEQHRDRVDFLAAQRVASA